MSARCPPAPRRLFPLPMLAAGRAAGTRRCGSRASACTSTSALEVMIWMIFALGYNLLLGYAGLPSFGHGAYFGVGAYAFGLLQQQLLAPNLWVGLAGAVAGRRARRRAGGALHLAPARHLLRAADHRLRPGVLVRRRQVAQRDRRRGRPAQHQAPAGRLRLRSIEPAEQRGALLLLPRASSRWSLLAAVAPGAFAVRPRAARDQAERDARRLRRLQRLALQVAGLHDLGAASPAWPARCSRWRSSRPTRT